MLVLVLVLGFCRVFSSWGVIDCEAVVCREGI